MERTPTRLASAAALAIAAITIAGCSPGASGGSDGSAEISFTFWGNDVRAEMYEEAIAEFETQHPDIDVNILFLAPQDYWEKRQVEAAGGGLPDVVTMDLAYLRQYSESGSLLDLEPYLGTTIQTDPLDDQLLRAGVVDGVTTALPLSTNAWGMYLNTTLIDDAGAEPFTEGSWEEYFAWMQSYRDAASEAGVEAWGAVDPTTRFTNFEIFLRAQGKELFSDAGQPGFTEDDMREFWALASPSRESQAVVPQQRVEEVAPLTGFDAALAATDITWDNSGSGFAVNLGEGYELALVAPPLSEPDGEDLYLKASQMYSIAANSEHPEAAAELIDFLVNSPESGEIFGSNRGLPASETAREAADLDEISAMIAEYEASIQNRLGDAPPVPIVGYGSLHEKFRMLGEELGYGTLSVDDAVAQFFTEMDVVLGQ